MAAPFSCARFLRRLTLVELHGCVSRETATGSVWRRRRYARQAAAQQAAAVHRPHRNPETSGASSYESPSSAHRATPSWLPGFNRARADLEQAEGDADDRVLPHVRPPTDRLMDRLGHPMPLGLGSGNRGPRRAQTCSGFHRCRSTITAIRHASRFDESESSPYSTWISFAGGQLGLDCSSTHCRCAAGSGLP